MFTLSSLRLSSIDTKYHIWKMGVVFTDNVSSLSFAWLVYTSQESMCTPIAWRVKLYPFFHFSFTVFPVPGVVYHDVYPRPLQQFLLCCSPARHCHGFQDFEDHPVFGHPQRQTGFSASEPPNTWGKYSVLKDCWYCLQLVLRFTFCLLPLF